MRLAALAFALLLPLAATAQTRPEITRPQAAELATFLYVGNSFFYYNNGMPAFVTRFAEGATPPARPRLSSTMIGIGGSGFDWHDLESYLRPNAIGRYSFTGNNDIVFNTRARLFDAVVMMDCSQCPIHPQLAPIFTEYAARNAEIARRHGAEPVLFMSWAYADKPEMTAELAEAYTRAGNASRMLVIPAGLAFARVVREHPAINLYQPDRRHPTVAGTYLAAAVLYAAFTGRSPVENSFTSGLDPASARTLREAAWATVREYYGWP